MEELIKFLDKQLGKEGDSRYFCGKQISIVDILYYTEIRTISTLLGREVVPPNTKIEAWYSEAMQREEIRDLDREMKNAIDEYKRSKKRGMAAENRFNDMI